MNKKIIIITIIVFAILIIALWIEGIIPKQIAKIYGSNYMKSNFPEMELEYVNVEWNKYYGYYIITFKDKNNQKYGCAIGPKYFPVNLGQGMYVIEETYRQNYSK